MQWPPTLITLDNNPDTKAPMHFNTGDKLRATPALTPLLGEEDTGCTKRVRVDEIDLSDDDDNSARVSIVPTKLPSPFTVRPCTMCKRTFVNDTALALHMRHAHEADVQSASYFCAYCQTVKHVHLIFANKEVYEGHMRCEHNVRL